jgi:CBS domain-containing protein
VIVCSPYDSVTTALETMRRHRVRRLPVLADGKLVGVVSMNDLALAAAASPGETGRPSYKDVVSTLQTICAPRTQADRAAA